MLLSNNFRIVSSIYKYRHISTRVLPSVGLSLPSHKAVILPNPLHSHSCLPSPSFNRSISFFTNKSSPSSEGSAGSGSAGSTSASNVNESKTNSSQPVSKFDDFLSSWHQFKPKLRTYAIFGGTALFGYLIFKGGMSIVDFFASINFLDVGEAAFVAGMVTAFTIMGTFWSGHRFLSLRPEAIFKMVLNRISNDNAVKALIGQQIKPAQFRAYSYVPGRILLPGSGKLDAPTDSFISRYWQPRRLQLFFQVSGSDSQGMVSAEVSKTWRGLDIYHTLAVDALDERGGRVVLEGDPAYKIYQGIIKLR